MFGPIAAHCSNIALPYIRPRHGHMDLHFARGELASSPEYAPDSRLITYLDYNVSLDLLWPDYFNTYGF